MRTTAGNLSLPGRGMRKPPASTTGLPASLTHVRQIAHRHPTLNDGSLLAEGERSTSAMRCPHRRRRERWAPTREGSSSPTSRSFEPLHRMATAIARSCPPASAAIPEPNGCPRCSRTGAAVPSSPWRGGEADARELATIGSGFAVCRRRHDARHTRQQAGRGRSRRADPASIFTDRASRHRPSERHGLGFALKNSQISCDAGRSAGVVLSPSLTGLPGQVWPASVRYWTVAALQSW
jgi:hypothetical protein